MLAFVTSYQAKDGVVVWAGRTLDNREAFVGFLADRVCSRLYDLEMHLSFEADMRALATTEMSTDTLKQLLDSEADPEPWEVGEAIAECLLEDDSVRLPTNARRDKRTPRASLPGADLIGFAGGEADPWLALGEVKTSSDSDSPPSVMSGRGGLIHQLDQLVSRIDIHICLLRYLYPRCKEPPLQEMFQKAVARYLASSGRDIVLYGMLMRDTRPLKSDLANRAAALATGVTSPTRIILAAWYLPVPIAQWVESCRRAA